MKQSRWPVWAGVVALVVMGGVVSAADKDNDSKDVALNDIPAEVRATAEAQVPGGKLTEAELETEDGQKVYSIEAVTADGEKIEIEVSADGKLIAVEKDVALNDIPAEVRTTAEAQVPGGKLTEAELETEDGQTIYSIDAVTSDGKKLEIEMSADGKLIKVEKDDDDNDSKEVALNDLPAEVRATAEAQVPGGKLTEAELENEDGKKAYSIEAVTADGAKLEIEVSANGKLIAVEKEVALADLPAEVRATAEAQAPGGKLTEAELETKDGKMIYSIDAVTSDGKKLEIEVSADGKLIKVEKKDRKAKDGKQAKQEKQD